MFKTIFTLLMWNLHIFAYMDVVKITNIDQFNAYFYQPSVHPLVSVGDLSRANLDLYSPTDFGMYCVVLMDVDFGELVKCGNSVRYKPGTMFWLRPGQTVSMNLDHTVKPRGMMLAFREEFLEKCGLGRDFYMFDFFNHDVNEALELTLSEKNVILNSFANIQAELLTKSDYLTNHLVRLNIGLLLSYCKRYFERQFEERRPRANRGIKDRLDAVLDNYLSSGLPEQQGQPTVAWCAAQFNLSANYFGELVKREIHITAQDYIQDKIVIAAQQLLASTGMSINEIAEQLGFAYTTHFTRMFHNRTGVSPSEYRKKEVMR